MEDKTIWLDIALWCAGSLVCCGIATAHFSAMSQLSDTIERHAIWEMDRYHNDPPLPNIYFSGDHVREF